jgi:coenzyme F420-reducing hydrogenase alpha subunit
MGYIKKMKAQELVDSSRDYLNYVEEHLEFIRKAFDEVTDACDGMAWVGDDFTWHTIRDAVESHDLSKLSKEEFTQYRDKFYPIGDNTDSSFSVAWENHKNLNSHHHETATNCNDIVHMVIDWVAMGYKFGDTAQSYYEANIDTIELSSDHKELLYEIFRKLELFRGVQL